jgi:hypothetical protein
MTMHRGCLVALGASGSNQITCLTAGLQHTSWTTHGTILGVHVGVNNIPSFSRHATSGLRFRLNWLAIAMTMALKPRCSGSRSFLRCHSIVI